MAIVASSPGSGSDVPVRSSSRPAGAPAVEFIGTGAAVRSVLPGGISVTLIDGSLTSRDLLPDVTGTVIPVTVLYGSPLKPTVFTPGKWRSSIAPLRLGS
ncbi:hypothetical protein GCM10010109_81170 [Actinoplanes campanulatus]|nr:hypothetical protein GCM10010109_81170 [Actinoplanes campanulatus]GID41175.1 hypothetical protein Aca09nite_76810 [Actinoplanes campanulatus]